MDNKEALELIKLQVSIIFVKRIKEERFLNLFFI
jgi:hypothetical protein